MCKAHRSGAKDENGFADLNANALLAMDCAGQGLNEGGMIERHVLWNNVDIARRNDDIVGHTAVIVNPELPHFRAEELLVVAAIPAMSAGDVDVGGGPIAFLDVAYARPHRRDFSGEFVADNQWQVRRWKPPFDDMGIRPADTTAMHSQEHFPRTGFGPLDFLKA